MKRKKKKRERERKGSSAQPKKCREIEQSEAKGKRKVVLAPEGTCHT